MTRNREPFSLTIAHAVRCREPGISIHQWIRYEGCEGGYHPWGLDDPCPHRPGSAEKVETMRRRVERGLEIWHDDDKDAARLLTSHAVWRWIEERDR